MGFFKTILKGSKRKIFYVKDGKYFVFNSENYADFSIVLYSVEDSKKILTLHYNSDFEGFLQSIFKIEDLKNKKNDK